jgi:hypothetical protein
VPAHRPEKEQVALEHRQEGRLRHGPLVEVGPETEEDEALSARERFELVEEAGARRRHRLG